MYCKFKNSGELHKNKNCAFSLTKKCSLDPFLLTHEIICVFVNKKKESSPYAKMIFLYKFWENDNYHESDTEFIFYCMQCVS